MRRLLLAMALCSVCEAGQADGIKVDVLAGTSTATAGSRTGLGPFARVAVGFPVASWECGDDGWRCAPRLHIRADFGGTAGEVVDLTAPASVRSVDFAGGISQQVHPSFFPALYCEAGASVLYSESPDNSLVWAGCGLRFDHFGRGWLNAIVTADERLGGGMRPAVVVQGSVALFRADGKGRAPKGTTVALVGTAVMGINSEAWAPGSPDASVSTGVTVGYGR